MATIITYKEKYRQDFIRLNTEWITTFFKIEACDIKTFEHVDDIIRQGGQIFIALDEDGTAIGCCALINHPECHSHELAKMAVSPQCHGRHTGTLLGDAAIRYARERGIKRLFLEGNTALEASIHLYRKLGFKEIPLNGNRYSRCDILMELLL